MSSRREASTECKAVPSQRAQVGLSVWVPSRLGWRPGSPLGISTTYSSPQSEDFHRQRTLGLDITSQVYRRNRLTTNLNNKQRNYPNTSYPLTPHSSNHFATILSSHPRSKEYIPLPGYPGPSETITSSPCPLSVICDKLRRSPR